MNKSEGDKKTSPTTPTKRTLSVTGDSDVLGAPKKMNFPSTKGLDSPTKRLQSPQKLPDSPKISAFNSYKSRFFDTNEGSELPSISRPRQFFDNSNLGVFPGKSHTKGRVQIFLFFK